MSTGLNRRRLVTSDSSLGRAFWGEGSEDTVQAHSVSLHVTKPQFLTFLREFPGHLEYGTRRQC
jgi:hypothetical protein